MNKNLAKMNKNLAKMNKKKYSRVHLNGSRAIFIHLFIFFKQLSRKKIKIIKKVLIKKMNK